jgi:hypothetical protein
VNLLVTGPGLACNLATIEVFVGVQSTAIELSTFGSSTHAALAAAPSIVNAPPAELFLFFLFL